MVSTYIPLYRKYRPQIFKDLVGQEAIVKTLSNAIELNRVAHAYLFTGPRGTGKTSTARIFAKSLNCENGPTLEPCGKCSSCLDIANGSAIDVIEIDAASNRKVEDARNLLEKVQFVPVAGKYKVYIIDEVHMLTTEAFNTLLKTLEEPPQNLVFILATTESHKVLNTIISRCQKFDFRRISQDLIIKRLEEIAKIENINISNQALSIIARRASGGLRDALGLLDQAGVLASLQEEVTEKDILTLLGSMSEDTLYQLTEALADKNSGDLLVILNEIIQLGNEPVQILRELMNYFRNLMLISTAKNIDEIRNIIDVSEFLQDKLKEQSKKFEITEIAQIIEKVSEYERILKNTSQQHLWLEVALINICHRNDIQVIKDLEARLSSLEEKISGGNISVSSSYVPPKQTFTRPDTPVKKPDIPITPVQSTPIVQPVEIPQKIEEKQEIKPVEAKAETQVIQESSEKVSNLAANIANLSGDVNYDWNTLLNNIESIPSRMFFNNLAKPVEINAEKIVITFNIESFVKQAQEKSKITPLEKAAQKLFGNLPRIITRTPLPEDDKIRLSSTKPVNTANKTMVEEPVKAEKFEQISQEFTEARPSKAAPKVAVAEAPIEPIDDEIIDQMNSINNSVSSVNLSDQAKMVIDLFQGKIIE